MCCLVELQVSIFVWLWRHSVMHDGLADELKAAPLDRI